MAGRVLVVDDEKMIVKGLKFSLMQDYSVVDCAYDGDEALEYAKNNEYDGKRICHDLVFLSVRRMAQR